MSPLSDDLDRGTVRIWSVQLILFVSSLFSILEATLSNHGKRVSEVPKKVLNFYKLWVVDRPVCTKYVCVHGIREEVGLRSGGRRVLYTAFYNLLKNNTTMFLCLFLHYTHNLIGICCHQGNRAEGWKSTLPGDSGISSLIILILISKRWIPILFPITENSENRLIYLMQNQHLNRQIFKWGKQHGNKIDDLEEMDRF